MRNRILSHMDTVASQGPKCRTYSWPRETCFLCHSCGADSFLASAPLRASVFPLSLQSIPWAGPIAALPLLRNEFPSSAIACFPSIYSQEHWECSSLTEVLADPGVLTTGTYCRPSWKMSFYHLWWLTAVTALCSGVPLIGIRDPLTNVFFNTIASEVSSGLSLGMEVCRSP